MRDKLYITCLKQGQPIVLDDEDDDGDDDERFVLEKTEQENKLAEW